MPLFLSMVQQVALSDPALAARALAGLRRYEAASEPDPLAERRPVARHRGAALREVGGSGPPLVIIPSLINPPDVLDLDEDVSLAAFLTRTGHRVLLLDWGAANDRIELDVGGHVSHLFLPLLATLPEPPSLVGYCLGGTMALAAAELATVRRVATLAAPWRFSAYPESVLSGIAGLLGAATAVSEQLQLLPMEVLQTGFWGLDPARVVAKFAAFADLPPGSAEEQRFVRLERWANGGEPLPLPAAKSIVFDFFGRDLPGRGEWQVAGRRMTGSPAAPTLHFTALDDRISPAAAAAPGPNFGAATGHVGLIIGRAGISEVRPRLASFLASDA